MILDFCLTHRDRVRRDLTPEAFDHNDALIAAVGAPLSIEASQFHAVATSALFEHLVESGERSWDGVEIGLVQRIRKPSPAEYARLISKGRILYEHCMTEVSHACVVGFMHHELKKSRAAEQVIYDLLGWMIKQRLALVEIEKTEGEEALRRGAHTDFMLDQGVSFLHGLGRAAAAELAEDKEPLD